MADAVKDTDRGWARTKLATAKADGLELRTGILDWRLRYPSTAAGAKGTEIAKVAGILKLYGLISRAYDSHRTLIESAFQRLHAGLCNGTIRDPDTWIYENLGQPLREAMRAALATGMKPKTHRMQSAVRATVFDTGGRLSKGPAYRGKKVAGDNPSAPKATQKPKAD